MNKETQETCSTTYIMCTVTQTECRSLSGLWLSLLLLLDTSFALGNVFATFHFLVNMLPKHIKRIVLIFLSSPIKIFRLQTVVLAFINVAFEASLGFRSLPSCFSSMVFGFLGVDLPVVCKGITVNTSMILSHTSLLSQIIQAVAKLFIGILGKLGSLLVDNTRLHLL